MMRWAVLYKSRQGCDGRVPGFTQQADQVFLGRCGDGSEVRHFHHAGCRQLARSMEARSTLACFAGTARVMTWPDRPAFTQCIMPKCACGRTRWRGDLAFYHSYEADKDNEKDNNADPDRDVVRFCSVI